MLSELTGGVEDGEGDDGIEEEGLRDSPGL
jgi:hypothetical protein